jgi:hypothetical protein
MSKTAVTWDRPKVLGLRRRALVQLMLYEGDERGGDKCGDYALRPAPEASTEWRRIL